MMAEDRANAYAANARKARCRSQTDARLTPTLPAEALPDATDCDCFELQLNFDCNLLYFP